MANRNSDQNSSSKSRQFKSSITDEITVKDKQAEAKKKRQEQKEKLEFLKTFHLTEQQYDALQAKKREEARLRTAKKAHEYEMEALEAQVKYSDNAAEAWGASMQLAAKKTAAFLKDAANQAYNSAVASVNTYAGLLAQYQSSISARTQGSGKTFNDMYDLIRKNIGSSQYVKQTTVLENLSALVKEGIAYNVEQRAFLNSIKDDIATTFDAANGTLLQLIRIQQADTTASRLGMEAYLTRFLNATFQDTSYLNRGYDATSAALLGLSSTLGAKQATELEFIAQKWLGSLASVGVSDATLSALAQGINALGTGDISTLANNSALQSLLVMASNRAGISYAETLTGGLTGKNLNKLMESIVLYGQQIAQSTNNVVRNQYAQLFGLQLSDLAALGNLDTSTLQRIGTTNMTYENMLGEVDYQIGQLPKRLHISERIQNLLDNTLATIGGGIANNPAMYTAWIVNDLVEAATGGINIPAVFGLGTGVNLNATVNQLAKVALIGTSLMGSIGTVLGGLIGKTPSLNNWGASDITSRGRTLLQLGEGVSQTTSQSTFVGNTDYSTMYEQTITSATDQAKETVKGSEYDENQLKDAIIKDIAPDIKLIYELLDSIRSGNAIRVQTQASGAAGGW